MFSKRKSPFKAPVGVRILSFSKFEHYKIRKSLIMVLALSLALLLPLLGSGSGFKSIAFAAGLTPTPNSWTLFNAPNAPASREQHLAVWDPDAGVMLVHGGVNLSVSPVSFFNDTFSLDPGSGTWSSLSGGGSDPSLPPPRSAGCGVWDTVNHQMLTFGGHTGLQGDPDSRPRNVVWGFNPVTKNWKQYSSPSGPIPADGRQGVACAWVPSSGKMLVWGGNGDAAFAFDPSGTGGWTQLTSSNDLTFICGRTSGPTPGSRFFPAYAWNSDLGSLTIWGGYDTCATSNPFNDVWSFNPGNFTTNSGSWTKLTISGALPTQRTGFPFVWDPTVHQMIGFGGSGGNSGVLYNDLWSLKQVSLTEAIWSYRAGENTPPAARHNHTGVYVPDQNQVLYFGGDISGSGLTGELWSLGPAPNFSLKFNGTCPDFTAGGGCSNITVSLVDPAGAVVVPSTSANITVRSNPDPNSGCGFSLTASSGCPSSAFSSSLALTIGAGQTSSNPFNFSDTLSGKHTLFAYSGKASFNAFLAVNVSPLPTPVKLVFSVVPPSSAVQDRVLETPCNLPPTFPDNLPCSAALTLVDQYGNSVNNASDPISLNLVNNTPAGAGAILNGQTTLNASSGRAIFRGLSIGNVPSDGNSYLIHAVGAGFTADSPTITVSCSNTGLIVNTTTDLAGTPGSTSCLLSLRQAIGLANSSTATNRTVTFAPGLGASPVMSLSSPLPVLAANTSLIADCTNPVTIPGGLQLTGRNTVQGLKINKVGGFGLIMGGGGNVVRCSFVKRSS